jgi:hypothetical protein
MPTLFNLEVVRPSTAKATKFHFATGHIYICPKEKGIKATGIGIERLVKGSGLACRGRKGCPLELTHSPPPLVSATGSCLKMGSCNCPAYINLKFDKWGRIKENEW